MTLEQRNITAEVRNLLDGDLYQEQLLEASETEQSLVILLSSITLNMYRTQARGYLFWTPMSSLLSITSVRCVLWIKK